MYVTRERSLVEPGAIAISGPIIGGPRGLGAALPVLQPYSAATGLVIPNVFGIPWYVLLGLGLLGFWYFGVRSQPAIAAAGQRVRRARARTLPAWKTALYAAGAGGVGYLVGKASQ